MPTSRVFCVLGLLLTLVTGRLVAERTVPMPLVERARGAERVVLARVVSVAPVWRHNEFGDQLIVSIARLAVDETLKGEHTGVVEVEIEGGSIGELTLRVSDLAPVVTGERGVYYLRRSRLGSFVPHLRGQGILKLDVTDRVPGSSLTLGEIRRTVAAAARER